MINQNDVIKKFGFDLVLSMLGMCTWDKLVGIECSILGCDFSAKKILLHCLPEWLSVLCSGPIRQCAS